ncbi:LEAF RUST 10 DISEASE-RESISTANCE LOCUS RECEPTOR-LIKE PROTEIN KINASE-like 1.2 isoform X5 [Triticum dicoccoides]|uniref:LEAF RUST 10 DISEASE-RESISTANCE LOCUS RECEPTOR-LIKE PROTEIN KINASE-like 1.2 isoform X5 n=1 Tax=Triticum dicoccoides TaxID=85692 RepID=UPI0018906E7C|nr:LEAF RUST 10 DISEASE-RESISTANCE LOCUS RECEPTOR-LIKE PROTEIN KINASE-like 1.2 isoform X5 [Triticum dicoccoides]
MAPSCWFFLALWLPLVLVVVAAVQQVEAGCSGLAKRCGNLTISDPFWLNDWETGRPCGYPDFEVTCFNSSTPVLLSSVPLSYGFAIVNISYEEERLHVVDVGKLKLLNASSSCEFPVWNTTIKLGVLFRIAPVNLNLVLYNCTEQAGAAALARRQRELVPTRMRCGNGSEVYAKAGGRYSEETSGYSGYEGCDAAVTPVLGAYGKADAGDYKQLISHGFLLTWELPRDSKRTKTVFIVVGSLGAALALMVFVIYVLHQRRRKKKAMASNEFMRSGSSMTTYSKDLELGGSPHIFTFEELEVATDGFSASRELGDGGFGTVYKGKLKDGRVVAVKRLYKNNYRRVEQFLNEVDILSRLLHQNLVILYGCTSRMSRDLLLVYEFIANGTVADHLHGSRSAERGLTWPLRLNIAIETAEALAYLHAVEIIHRDVKTTNILLDNNFHVKVADFGLSRLFPLEVTHVSTVPQGTPGYVDPVYHQCYKLTDKSDVYSFGVVLVELISSKPAVDMSRSHSEINLANMALNRIQNHEVVQLVDPELGYDTDPETKRTIDRVAEVAFQCLQMERDLRPSIKEVVEILTCVRDGDYQSKSMKKKASQKEDAHLLTEGLQFSPDTVIHRFDSQSTNHSVASNASGL